jgi:hypothetical protein
MLHLRYTSDRASRRICARYAAPHGHEGAKDSPRRHEDTKEFLA